MTIPEDIKEFILSAENKALGTCLDTVVNVVPVSSIKIVDEQIILVNYFMNKTTANLEQNHRVALACWSGFVGYQIKGTCEYLTAGSLFAEIKDWVAETLPERTVKGVLVLTPQEIFSISPSTDNPGKRIV